MNFTQAPYKLIYIAVSADKLAFDIFFIIFDLLNQHYEKMDLFSCSAPSTGLFAG